MANATVRQSKLKRLVFAPQTAIGTAEILTSSSPAVPVIGMPDMAASRGTRRISRADVLDGYASEAQGVMGSFGWSLSFSSEIHDVAGPTYYPYWAQLLLCSGHFGDYDAGGTVTFTPTTREITAWTAPTTADAEPTCATFAVLNNHNDSGADSYSIMYDAVGSTTFNMTTGERITVDHTFVGRVENNTLFNTGSADLMQTGSFSQISGVPFVCKAMNVSVIDNATSQVVSTAAVNNISFSTGIETPDVEDMTDAHGFAMSPAFSNAGATVSFDVADTGGQYGTERYFMQNLLNGNTMQLVVGVTGSGGRTLEFNVPKIQFDDVTFGETNGYATFSVNGTATRDAGTSDSPYSIIWTYGS